jgi:hypothetical protein
MAAGAGQEFPEFLAIGGFLVENPAIDPTARGGSLCLILLHSFDYAVAK